MIVMNILQQTLKYQSTNPPRREVDIVENQPRGVVVGGRGAEQIKLLISS